MNPKTVQTLREHVPEFEELVAYLAKKVNESNTLEGLSQLSFKERAYEASVRAKVYERLSEILAPFLVENIPNEASDPSEYVV